MRRFIQFMIVTLILAGIPLTGLAKGQVDRMTLTDLKGQKPIEITDPSVLESFNPWAGQFLGTVLDDRPKAIKKAPYQVFMELEEQRGEPRVIYAFTYYPAEGKHPGYIKLPGPGDEWYRVNIGTVMRKSDGQWHEASPSWAKVMSTLAEPAEAPAGTSGQERSPAWSTLPMVAALAVLAVVGAAWATRGRWRPRLAQTLSPEG